MLNNISSQNRIYIGILILVFGQSASLTGSAFTGVFHEVLKWGSIILFYVGLIVLLLSKKMVVQAATVLAYVMIALLFLGYIAYLASIGVIQKYPTPDPRCQPPFCVIDPSYVSPKDAVIEAFPQALTIHAEFVLLLLKMYKYRSS